MKTTFIRLVSDRDKAAALRAAVCSIRSEVKAPNVYVVDEVDLRSLPGVPFAYWCSNSLRAMFKRLAPYEISGRSVKFGLSTTDDFRFVRLWWELPSLRVPNQWPPFVKGGRHSRFYSDIPTAVNWKQSGKELYANSGIPFGGSGAPMRNPKSYFARGITWPLRGIGFSAQAVPDGCIFSSGGKMAFAPEGELPVLLAIFNSAAFNSLILLFAGKVGGVQYEVGLIQKMPVPQLDELSADHLRKLAYEGWWQRRNLDSIVETSHAFRLPRLISERRNEFDANFIEVELRRIQAEVDRRVYESYGFEELDKMPMEQATTLGDDSIGSSEDTDPDDTDLDALSDSNAALLSWALGVAFGRFDWKLATNERLPPPEPGLFDALSPKSPGMLPDGETPFHSHDGVLVDDKGHVHDLAHAIEEVLERVDMPIPDVRRWLRRDFFPLHLQSYSKKGRKAPIYWPLSTRSGSYTLWLYYPSLTDQTLFTSINDFLEPKLRQVGAVVATLRNKGSTRSLAEESRLEELQDLEAELTELRDELLSLAQNYQPNQEDGVQITAAPFWPLFRHKPWQKLLKETWTKLEKGDYDWAHMAMSYWPDRVREKCKREKSLAIAHGLDSLYVGSEKKSNGKARKRVATE